MEEGGSSERNDRVRRRVGLVYDERMCKHHTPDGEDHPECPDRIRVIWNKLRTSALIDRFFFIIFNFFCLISCSSFCFWLILMNSFGFNGKLCEKW